MGLRQFRVGFRDTDEEDAVQEDVNEGDKAMREEEQRCFRILMLGCFESRDRTCPSPTHSLTLSSKTGLPLATSVTVTFAANGKSLVSGGIEGR